MKYWLMKSEPSCFSIDDLKKSPNQTTPWDGVRNYQARNYIRDDMALGDLILFYHSNCAVPGIVGIAKVIRTAYPDVTAFDPSSDHLDPKSTLDNPRWYVVDVQFQEKFSEVLSLHELKNYPELANMILLRKGNRLSVLPVSLAEWQFIDSLVSHKR